MKRKLSYFFKEEKGLTFLVVLFGITFNISQIFSPIFLGRLIDSLADSLPFDQIIKNVILYFSVVTGIMILRFLKRYLVRVFANRTSRRMRGIMYDTTIHESLEFMESHTIGDLMTRCISDVDATVEGIRKSLTEIFDTGVLMSAYFITLLIYDYKTTLIASIFIPISIGIAYLLKKTIYKANKDYKKEATRLSEKTFMMVDNAGDLRNHGALENVTREYEEELKIVKKKQIRANLLEGSMEPMYKSIAYLGIFFVLFFSAKHVINQDSYFLGLWTVGACMSYLKLYTSFSRKASKVSKLLNTITKAKVSYERIAPYLVERESSKSSTISCLSPILEVKDLSVSYGERNILDSISFTAKAGDIIGVTGPVGSGKSTLGLALTGLIPYEGSITLGGIELRELPKEIKAKNISYQGHNPYLLSDSIKENVSLGEDKDVMPALEDVAFIKDLSEMKEKEYTSIGQNGVKLSGGQKQRISLARALYHSSTLVILDDPFSASDYKTEEEIIQKIKKKYKDSIIILISHRLQIFPYTQQVLFIEDGKITKETHENLLVSSPSYKEIYSLQKEGFTHA